MGAIPALAPAVRAVYANDLVEIIDGWDGGGSGALSARLNSNDEVIVTGTVLGAMQPLLLDIDPGVTVVWGAALSGTVGYHAENMCLVRLTGDGTFNVAQNGAVMSDGPGGYAINAEGSNGTIIVSGGTVSSTAGTAIYAPCTVIPIEDTGGSSIDAIGLDGSGGSAPPEYPTDTEDLEDPSEPVPPPAPPHSSPGAGPGGPDGPGSPGIGPPDTPGPGYPSETFTSCDVMLTGGTVRATDGTAIQAENVYVFAGSTVTVTSTGRNPAIILENYGSVFVDAGELTVNGDIVDGFYAISADNGALVTLNGNAVGTLGYGVEANNGSTVNVAGSIQSGEQSSGGIYATFGAEVTVIGDITVESYGVWAFSSIVTVTGNIVIGEYAQGVYAGGAGASVIVNGNVCAGDNSDGVCANKYGSTVTINGNVNAGGKGIYAIDGGNVIVNGTIDAEIYVSLYDDSKAENKATILGIDDDTPSTKQDYREYTDGKNTVWVVLPGIIKPETGDAMKVAEDKAWLTWDVIKGNNVSQDSVAGTLILPLTGASGSSITWQSSDSLVNTDFGPGFGSVLRPPSGAADKLVILTATIVSGDVSETVTFDLILLADPPDNDQYAVADMNWLTWDVLKKSNQSQERVTSDLNLPVIGANGSIIMWHYHASTVSRPINLETGVVTRPPSGSGNMDVTIVATIMNASALRFKIFDLTVLEAPSDVIVNVSDKGNSNPPPEPKPEEIAEPEPAVPLAEGWTNPYDDVADPGWFYDAVQFVTESGLMNGTGDGKFSPSVIVSRAMLVTVLYRLEGGPAVSGETPFADVKSGEWYSDAILWAGENDIVVGYSDGTFGLNDPVTREQAVAIIYRYAISKDLDVSPSSDLSRFSDVGDISDWALDAMKWAIAEGIIQGRTATTAAPQGTSTRAEVAMIFKRFIESADTGTDIP